jgi:uncharacterized protein
MENISIPQLKKQPNNTLILPINTYLPDLPTLMPVKGEMTLVHQGTYLEVRAIAETIVTLDCHRCLQHYNHRIAIAPVELIWLEAPPEPTSLPLEQEVSLDQLVETLPPEGYFDPVGWLYEQICLALPQRQICDVDCSGIELHPETQPHPSADTTDHRWAALTQLQQQLKDLGEG